MNQPSTLKKRKKREVWVVELHPGSVGIRDADTMFFEHIDGDVEKPVLELPTRSSAEAYAKEKGWKVV